MNIDEVLRPYEQSAMEQAQRWLNREPGWMDRILEGVSSRSRQALDLVLATGPGRSLLRGATDRAIATLQGTVLSDLEGHAHAPAVPADSAGREAALQRADARVAELRDTYVRILGAQGALAGAASLTATLSAVALVADVTLAVVVTLRAGANHLAVYGFAPSQPSALEGAVELVAVATETEAALRKAKIVDLSQRLVAQRSKGDVASDLPRVVVQQASSRAVKEVVEQTVRRVLGRRLAGVVPVVGAVAGGATSGWLAAQVCETGRQVGRVAFLTRHTPLELGDVLGVDVPVPADGWA